MKPCKSCKKCRLVLKHNNIDMAVKWQVLDFDKKKKKKIGEYIFPLSLLSTPKLMHLLF